MKRLLKLRWTMAFATLALISVDSFGSWALGVMFTIVSSVTVFRAFKR
jgi:hypothetical protein